ncbi:AfsR/SARP family transcriptional regulator [Jiangella ureilytica]|uniref:AfsR/SARP family transcriptional regulator n=1 Tax=Jiangella ureilytica TaxID=2530374 RepID=UPI0013A5E201|nr:BTAD domain-containing putative transcriptional regulator [Jiangella ureilytica]
MTATPNSGAAAWQQDGRDVRIALLGPFEVLRDGFPVLVTSERLRGVLAVLAASAARTVSADVIGEHVWGDAPPVNLRRTVQTGIARLRAMLPDDAIVRRPGGYVLDLGPGQVDALRFEALLDEAAAIADPHTERKLVGQALELWRGVPYLGVEARALASVEVPRLTERYLGALERAADLSLAAGEIDESAARLRAETARHPLRESLWARLLRLLAAAGRTAEALATYDDVRRRLADELGADPGPELRRLHAELLDPGADPVAADPVTSSAPGVPPRAPVPSTDPARGPASGPASGVVPGSASGSASAGVDVGAVRPRQLPADIELVGRAGLLEALDEAFRTDDPAAPGTVAVAMTGQGGAGKTALAVHWAHRRQEWFPDGQIFVDLRGFADRRPVEPLTALGEVLGSLGVPPDQVPAGVDARAALYRTLLAGRRLLVVLDNVRDSEQVRPLLPGAAGRVLVTSRSTLRGLSAREGARRITVDQLPAADAVALLGERLRRHGLTVGPDDATTAAAGEGSDSSAGEIPIDGVTLAELAELCERLPLALVIAAEYLARHRDLDPSALVRELRDGRTRLEALDDLGDGPTASVRAVLSWSYAALDPEAARAFRLLAHLTPFEFSAELAGSVAARPVPDMRRLLDHLADLSLLASVRGRYRFHDLVRVYAAVLCEATDDGEERWAASIRGLDWYLHSVCNAAQRLRPRRQEYPPPALTPGVRPMAFDDPESARDWCVTEHRALAFATQRAYDFGRYEQTWRLAWDFGRVLLIGTAHRDLRVAVARLGVAAAEHLGAAALYIAQSNLGNAYQRSGDSLEAVACLREALAGCRAAGDVGTESAVLVNLAIAQNRAGDKEGAVGSCRAALEAAARWEADPAPAMIAPAVAVCHFNLGHALVELGRFDEGIAETRTALELSRRDGHRIIEGLCLSSLAEAHLLTGDLDRAETCAAEAKTVLRTMGATDGLVDVLLTEVRLGSARGRPGDARPAYDEALRLLGSSPDPRRDLLDAAMAG